MLPQQSDFAAVIRPCQYSDQLSHPQFAQVLEQLRSDLALRYLGEPSLSISQIALVRTRESAMADRKNLGIIGCILSGAAAVVIEGLRGASDTSLAVTPRRLSPLRVRLFEHHRALDECLWPVPGRTEMSDGRLSSRIMPRCMTSFGSEALQVRVGRDASNERRNSANRLPPVIAPSA
jgi:hypothetical protein